MVHAIVSGDKHIRPGRLGRRKVQRVQTTEPQPLQHTGPGYNSGRRFNCGLRQSKQRHDSTRAIHVGRLGNLEEEILGAHELGTARLDLSDQQQYRLGLGANLRDGEVVERAVQRAGVEVDSHSARSVLGIAECGKLFGVRARNVPACRRKNRLQGDGGSLIALLLGLLDHRKANHR